MCDARESVDGNKNEKHRATKLKSLKNREGFNGRQDSLAYAIEFCLSGQSRYLYEKSIGIQAVIKATLKAQHPLVALQNYNLQI